MDTKDCTGPLCNVKKVGENVDVSQLANKKNRDKLCKMLVAFSLSIVVIWFVLYPPGGAPLIGEPIDPVSGSFAVLGGIMLGMAMMMFVGIIWVVKKKKK